MRKSRLSKIKQERLLEYFVAGVTARCAASLANVNNKTAAYCFHRLREVITHQLELESQEVVGGEIEVDESWVELQMWGCAVEAAEEMVVGHRDR